MRTTTKTDLFMTALTALLVLLPRVTAAQDTLHKTKKAPPSSTTTTVPNAKAPKGAIENSSFPIGASNVNPTKGNGTKAGNAAAAIGAIKTSSKGKGTNKLVSPIYKGPKVIVPPPSPPQPNDSLHKRPKH